MSRPHPFQLLCKVSPNTNNESNVLVAACGEYLISASLSKQGDVPAGVIHSRWPPNSQNNNSEQDAAEPQQKKRKLDQRETSKQPSITLLIAAPDQQHIVAVTGADKCIRVFEVKGGALEELSQRCMPKRPCAIQVTEDSKTIVCADKFGDVYSLPLQHTTNGEGAAAASQSNGASKQKLYEPAAHETTVHTKRNLKALQEQMRAKGKPTNSTKEPLAFEHKLLLGHVSMLTDLQLVCHEVEGKRKRYIMTCDRDEHIRISRGIPQTHIVESYCLGHTEFVHCIRHIPSTTTLVSAGGDDWLGVWDWLTGKLLKKHSLRDIRQFEDDATEQESKAPIAVRNIWLMSSSKSEPLVVVSCEGIAALAVFGATNLLDGEITFTNARSHGQILDMVDIGQGKAVVSSQKQGLQIWHVEDHDGSWFVPSNASEDHKLLDPLNDSNDVPEPDQAGLDMLLHGVEKLRKRDNEEEKDE